MGQRSQIYVRYNGGKSLVAIHLQWNWGRYMINRTYQLLNYIEKNLEDTYSNFLSEHFEIANSGKRRDDISILKNLIQINMTCGSWVGGVDIVKAEKEFSEDSLRETFKINPREQDNNNGILIIDISNNKEIKYGLTVGYEGEGNHKEFEIVNAREYMNAYKEDLEFIKENGNEEEYLKLTAEIEKQLIFLEKFKVMEQAEFEAIFNKEYKFEDCGVTVEMPF